MVVEKKESTEKEGLKEMTKERDSDYAPGSENDIQKV